MSLPRRLSLVAALVALLCASAFAVGHAVENGSDGRAAASAPAPAAAPQPPAATTSAPAPIERPQPRHTRRPAPAPTATATPDPTPGPTRKPEPKPEPTPALQPGPALLRTGDQGDRVRDLQARLKQIAWFDADVTGLYGDVTTAAVRGFQAKREIPVTGEVDQRTLDRLAAMTHTPTDAELHDRANTPGALDPRCRTGRVLCIDKTTSTLRWVVDGQVLQTLDARFGASTTPTREGLFHVYTKDADHVSRLYGSSMPYAMFFSGGQAVHYSSDFATVGYAGASHGCVNIRDHDGIARLFSQVRVGDAVVVYWS